MDRFSFFFFLFNFFEWGHLKTLYISTFNHGKLIREKNIIVNFDCEINDHARLIFKADMNIIRFDFGEFTKVLFT